MDVEVLKSLQKEGYYYKSLLGKGSFGSVVSALDSSSGRDVAVKHLSYVDEGASACVQIVREINVLCSLCHENILSLVDVRLSGNNIFIITENCRTDLFKVIYQEDQRDIFKTLFSSRTTSLRTIFQLLHAVSYMHSVGVIHRDIKPSNILLTANLDVKLCDFGFARYEADPEVAENSTLTEYMVTRWYRAPEVVLNPGKYGKPQDVWAVGCCICEIINRLPLFPGKNTVDQIKIIVDKMGTLTLKDLNFDMPARSRRFLLSLLSEGKELDVALEHANKIDPGLVLLLKSILQFNPDIRMSAAVAISSPLFVRFLDEQYSDGPVFISWATYHACLADIRRGSDLSTTESHLDSIAKTVGIVQHQLTKRRLDAKLQKSFETGRIWRSIMAKQQQQQQQQTPPEVEPSSNGNGSGSWSGKGLSASNSFVYAVPRAIGSKFRSVTTYSSASVCSEGATPLFSVKLKGLPTTSSFLSKAYSFFSRLSHRAAASKKTTTVVEHIHIPRCIVVNGTGQVVPEHSIIRVEAKHVTGKRAVKGDTPLKKEQELPGVRVDSNEVYSLRVIQSSMKSEESGVVSHSLKLSSPRQLSASWYRQDDGLLSSSSSSRDVPTVLVK